MQNKSNRKVYDKNVNDSLPDYIVYCKSGTRKRYLTNLRKTEYNYKPQYKQAVPSFNDILGNRKESFTLI